MRLSNALRLIVYPGTDLHTRSRVSFAKLWRAGPRDVFDAGSGNGMYAWLAYKSGATVVAWNYDRGQVEKAHDFFVRFRRADPQRLRFEHRNLYDLGCETRRFDEILCYETLEHIRDDRLIAREFFRLLRPGGTLHLCCPNRMHPHHRNLKLDLAERGGHVRPGYTETDYRELLEPLGFHIQRVFGVGSPLLVKVNFFIRRVRDIWGPLAIPFLPLVTPVVWCARRHSAVPFSLYVEALKPRHVE